MAEEFPHNLQPSQFYGKGLDHLFKGSDITGVPFPRAARLKAVKDYDEDLVRRSLREPPQLEEFDPRALHATQPNVTRGGVDYYMGGEYGRTGTTYADQGNAGNRHPFVYVREGMAEGPPTPMLLSGHHRATAALLKGEPLRARIVRGPWGQRRTP